MSPNLVPKLLAQRNALMSLQMHESLQLEIIAVIESLEQLKASAELEQEAEKLAEEIKELSGEEVSKIG